MCVSVYGYVHMGADAGGSLKRVSEPLEFQAFLRATWQDCGELSAERWKSSVFRACLSPTEHVFVNCAWVLPRAPGVIPGDFRRAILCCLPALGGFSGSSGIFNNLVEKTARDAIFILCQHQLSNRIETLVSPTCLIRISLSVTSTPLSHWDREDSSSLSSGEGTLLGFLRVDKFGNQTVSLLRLISECCRCSWDMLRFNSEDFHI